MSVDLASFVLLYNTNFMNKLKLNDFIKNKKLRKIFLDCTNFFNLQNHPTVHSERLVNLLYIVRGKRSLCLSIYIICHGGSFINFILVKCFANNQCWAPSPSGKKPKIQNKNFLYIFLYTIQYYTFDLTKLTRKNLHV